MGVEPPDAGFLGTKESVNQITHCKRCGTCCIKGGPTLHEADLPLIHNHRLTPHDLITIRLGEPVFSPLSNNIEPARTELIKVAGQNDSWACHFFDQTQKLCGIYAHRPLECGLLQCWEPSTLTNIIYQHCLSRKDIVPAEDELWELIGIQETHCAFAQIAALTTEFAEGKDQTCLTEIARVVTLDLKIRQRAIHQRRLRIAEELLFFGRPLFKSLTFYQLTFTEGPQGLTVMSKSPSLGA